MRQIIKFKDITLDDVSQVGGKNASLGEMIRELGKKGVNIPDGFATTSSAYFEFIKGSGSYEKIEKIISKINVNKVKDLNKKSKEIQKIILKASFSKKFEEKIYKFYEELSLEYGEKATDVAVRSSATAEDLPGASFAGQHETFLNVRGKKNLLLSVKKCIASLFLSRAISYREKRGFNHMEIALSVGVQKMIRSDISSSGVMFTLDTESGFPDVVLINGTWGLGEMIVQGKVVPDEFLVAKRLFIKGFPSIIKKKIGPKTKKLVYNKKKKNQMVQIENVSLSDRNKFVLSDQEVLKLTDWAIKVEKHYSNRAGKWRPMDIEWAKDGKTGRLFLIQARPETIHSEKTKGTFTEYKLKEKGEIVTTGIAVGDRIGSGKANVIESVKDIEKFKKGEVLVTEITDPDWEPIMKIASAIVTNSGGRTCHSAIISRELGIPCIVGTKNGTKIIENKKDITADCSKGTEGFIYKGKVAFEEIKHELKKISKTETKIGLNIGSPGIAFKSSFLPNDGVGLAREEFIFASEIKVHPLALLNFDKLDKKTQRGIEKVTAGWEDKKEFFVDKLAQGISRIATAFYPKKVIVRFSDFKANEYATLLGGEFFEGNEANPMIGWRGASRYYSENFKEAFMLECKAINKARREYGFKNISVMVPFCRTIEEGKKVISLIKKSGLISATLPTSRTKSDPKLYVMCEIPVNVILAKEFLEIFDGFSIGSNDLTQLTLGMDRDSAIIADIGDERNEAVKKMIEKAVVACKEKNKYCGICGDAPSTFDDFARFLVKIGIENISVTPDAAIKTRLTVEREEKKI